jgi:1,2-phenylacetyl-CoA epoxidase catalytic subunit
MTRVLGYAISPPVYDRLFDCAKLHVQAGVCQSRPVPLETIMMAVLLEQQKHIEWAHEMLEALQRRGQT